LEPAFKLRRLEPTGAVLGAFEEWNCAEDEISLDAGDTLLLYSDGVTEASNSNGDEFGEYRLACLLRERCSRTADDLVRGVVNAVAAFSGGSRTDDITVVAIPAFNNARIERP